MTLYAEALEAMERELLPRVLGECGWNQLAACEALGINRGTLRKKLKALGICKPEGMGVNHRSQSSRATSKPKPQPYSISRLIGEVVADANRRAHG